MRQLFDTLEAQLGKLKYFQLFRIIPSYMETAKEIYEDDLGEKQMLAEKSVQKIASELLWQNLTDMTCEERAEELGGILVSVLEELEKQKRM